MPLPLIPFLLWGGAAALGAFGGKKSVDAFDDFAKVKRIGENAEDNHKKAIKTLDADRNLNPWPLNLKPFLWA